MKQTDPNGESHFQIGSGLEFSKHRKTGEYVVEPRVVIRVTDPGDLDHVIELPFNFESALDIGSTMIEIVGRTKQNVALARLLIAAGKGQDEIVEFMSQVEGQSVEEYGPLEVEVTSYETSS